MLSVITHCCRRAAFIRNGMTREPLRAMLASVAAAAATLQLDVELVLVNWEGVGKPDAYIRDVVLPEAGAFTRLVSVYGGAPYTRGRARNIGAMHAKGSVLLFMDSDIRVLSPGPLARAVEVVESGGAYVPVVWSETEDGLDGQWRPTAKGTLGISRALYDAVGGWAYTGVWRGMRMDRWGGEDLEYFSRLEASGAPITREFAPDLCHQWHPTSTEWKEAWSRS